MLHKLRQSVFFGGEGSDYIHKESARW